MKTTVSIVTISYNAAAEIEKTIQSVLAQSYTDYEYVFIDGASKDTTVEIVESYREAFEVKGVAYRVYSGPDNGIYDAMNKGIDKANGEWTLMLNAGDSFIDAYVLEDIFQDKTYSQQVIYGDATLRERYQKKEYRRVCPAASIAAIRQHIPFCHQSVFVRTDILARYRFDTQWKLAADYDQFVRMYQDGIRFYHVERRVALYDYAGASIMSANRTIQESNEIRKQAGFYRQADGIKAELQKIRMRMRVSIKKLLPGVYFSKKRGWYQAENTEQ